MDYDVGYIDLEEKTVKNARAVRPQRAKQGQQEASYIGDRSVRLADWKSGQC
jgi:hypothetical protein